MEKLNLASYGVSEMSVSDAQTVDGGCFLTTLLVIAAVAIVAAIFATDNNPDTQVSISANGTTERIGN